MKDTKFKFSRKEQKKLEECDLRGCQTCGRILSLKYNFRFIKKRGTWRSPCIYCDYVIATNDWNKKKGLSNTPQSYEEWFPKYLNKRRTREFFDKIGLTAKERSTYNNVMFHYNTTPEETHELLKGDKVCAISGRPLNIMSRGTDEELHVDHCHQTGKIRGLLYGRFNVGLGCFEDNPDLLRAAANYIERTRDETDN